MISARLDKFDAYGDCLFIDNEIAEVVVSLEGFLRVVRYCCLDSENMLHDPDIPEDDIGHRVELYETGGAMIRLEGKPTWELTDTGAKVTRDCGDFLHELTISMAFGSSEVVLTHSVRNTGNKPVTLSLYSATSMEEGGLCVVPQPKAETGEEPNRLIALWPHTNMSDPRILWGQDYILVQQANMKPSKLGLASEHGWAAYFNMDCLMVVNFAVSKQGGYPDFGCNLEIDTYEDMTELLVLEPVTTIAPGEALVHTENWALYRNIPCPPMEEWAVGNALRVI